MMARGGNYNVRACSRHACPRICGGLKPAGGVLVQIAMTQKFVTEIHDATTGTDQVTTVLHSVDFCQPLAHQCQSIVSTENLLAATALAQ